MSAVEVRTPPRDEVVQKEAPPAHPPRRHHWRRWVAVVLGVLIVAWAATSVIAASMLTGGKHAPITVAATSIGTNYEEVSFPSRVDNLRLDGWLFHASPSNGRSVIFVHGWDANRVDTASGLWQKARDMVQHGYDALLFDMRTAGTSAGDRFTLGTKEPRDVLGAYDFMVSRGYAPGHMTVLAVSMGAASMLEAAPQLEKVGVLISDSAFSDLRPVLEHELPKYSPLPSLLFNWSTITAGSLLFDMNADLRPVDVVKSLPQRAFLFLHAAGDDAIPVSQAEELYQASGNGRSRLDVMEGPSHTKEYLTHPAEYMAAVYSFIDSQLGGSTSS